ncbi:MAG: hypothetical protein WCL53_04715 [Chloroflexota bacterium]
MTTPPRHIGRFARAVIEYVHNGGTVSACIHEDQRSVDLTITDPQLIVALVEAGENLSQHTESSHDGAY